MAEEKKSKTFWVTCSSPVNIAVIKYWGKRDVKLNLPINSSLSGSLHQNELKTTTTVLASADFHDDELFLNGKSEIINSRTKTCIAELRKRAANFYDQTTGALLVSSDEWKEKMKFKIYSYNNFPTAAGLASSASGFCCLVYTIAQLLNVSGDLTSIARQGSGSASRSLFGGFVKWEMGIKEDGSDSIATQVVDEKYWPDMDVLICVVNDNRKDVSSTEGMQQSVATSPLIPERIEVVPKRMIEMEEAIKERDFQSFARLTMLDSDHFHDVCHTSIPPIHYMNSVSKNIVQLINSFNDPEIRAAYTFDAGPNAVIYLPRHHVVELSSLLLHFFPPDHCDSSFINDEKLMNDVKCCEVDKTSEKYSNVETMASSIKYIIHTSIGPGPLVIDGMREGVPPEHLLFLNNH